MSPEDIKALRKDLACTARELASAIGVEQETVLAWERGELFPTKRHCDAMTELGQKGPAAVPRKPRKKGPPPTPMAALADPGVWRLVRKILAHPELRTTVESLAEPYADPAESDVPSR